MGRSWTCSGIVQPGAFASMKTVNRLPSTPSRNATPQPHARRARAKPFMVQMILQERFDLRFERRLLRKPDMGLADFSVASDDERFGQSPHRTVRFGSRDVVASVADQHGIVHLVFSGERLQLG